MVDLVERLNPLGKRIVCVTVPGDRRDEDIRDIAGQGRRALRHLPLPRRRQPARPGARRGAEADAGGAHGRSACPESAIELAGSETASIDTALEMARPNDLVLIFCDAHHPLPGSRSSTSAPASRRSRCRRSGWSPPPASTSPTATASTATSAASASCRRADRQRGMARRRPPRQPRRHRRPAGRQQRRGLRRDAPPRRRPDPRLPDRLRRARGGGRRRASQVFRAPRLRRRGGAAHAAERRGAWRATPTLIARVADYGSVYFTGGDQANIVGALAPGGVETPLLAAIRAARAAGGLVAGSSAGAAMMSQPMILGGTSIESVVHGVTADPEQPGLLLGDGLGFFRHGMVDQHFIKRGRLGRLVVAMAQAGVRRGFGIDENTALADRGRRRAGLRRIRRHAGRHGPRQGRPRRARASGTSASATSTTATASTSAGFRPRPGAGKRRVRKREIAYRAPARSRRNVFGAYTLYDLMARLVLGDPASLQRRPRRGVRRPVGRQRHRRGRAPAAPLEGADRHAGERPAGCRR